jgi:hypothetical protein
MAADSTDFEVPVKTHRPMFHVKHPRLLADAELAEDEVQQILHIDPPSDATDRPHRQP